MSEKRRLYFLVMGFGSMYNRNCKKQQGSIIPDQAEGVFFHKKSIPRAKNTKEECSMKKKKVMQTVLCGIALSAAVTVGASASTNGTATLRPDVTVCIDGVVRDFYNAQGKEVHPIIYNGTTYMPLRAVGELMGKNVNWDAATGTVSLSGTRLTGNVKGMPDSYAHTRRIVLTLRPEYHVVIDGTERTFMNTNGEKIEPAVYNGSIYLPLRAIGEIMGKAVRWNATTQTVCLDGVSVGNEVTDFDTNTSATSPNVSANGITLEQAKQIALSYIGKSATQVQFVKQTQDIVKGLYEVEFIVRDSKGYTEYDFEIDSATGKIIQYDYDAENAAPTQSISTQVKISEKAAKEKVLSRVPGATSSHIYKFKLDFDDGRWEYEGELYFGTKEYEFTIDANTGAIIEWDVESILSR